jgi:PPOX class probable FMN-dependent enzyme
MFRDLVTTEAQLRELMGNPSPGALKKETTYIFDEARRFVECSPMVFLATSGKDGRCDVAPKGDPNGFVRVLDEKHLLIPDRPGNRRFDGLRNIMENPQIGLLFIVPGRSETVRVNGRAWITRDEDLLATMEERGKRPWFALGVEVQECFMHCAKAFIRSELWQPESWPNLDLVPTGAELYISAAQPADETVADVAARHAEAYRVNLY